MLGLKREAHLLDKKLIALVKATRKYGRMGLKASISEFSVISHSFQPSSVLPVHTKHKIKSPTPQSHRPHSSTPLPHISSDQTIHLILSFFLSTRWRWQQQQLLLQKFKSNQEFHFPISSSNQISSTPPLLQTLHFTLSLSL